jgi:hypothetical protein
MNLTQINHYGLKVHSIELRLKVAISARSRLKLILTNSQLNHD